MLDVMSQTAQVRQTALAEDSVILPIVKPQNAQIV